MSTIAKEENSPVADVFLILRQKKTCVVKQQKKNAVKLWILVMDQQHADFRIISAGKIIKHRKTSM